MKSEEDKRGMYYAPTHIRTQPSEAFRQEYMVNFMLSASFIDPLPQKCKGQQSTDRFNF